MEKAPPLRMDAHNNANASNECATTAREHTLADEIDRLIHHHVDALSKLYALKRKSPYLLNMPVSELRSLAYLEQSPF